jgi:hypothetical protein
VFDKELWGIVGDDNPHVVARVVSNTVCVRPATGKGFSVVIRIPSGFFSYLRDVAKVSSDELANNPLRFYLEEMDGKWYFGYSRVGEYDTDMWPYASLPHWANRSRGVQEGL